MFDCKACQARAEEIQHLRAIITELQAGLEKAQQRVMELVEPGVNRRLKKVEEGAEMPKPVAFYRAPAFPGYESRPEPGIEISEDES